MSFRLLIECSKDLDSLQINFSDGTSVMQAVKDEPSIPDSRIENEEPTTMRPMSSSGFSGSFLDTDADFGTVSSEVIEKPDVSRPNREISVASELQNLDI